VQKKGENSLFILRHLASKSEPWFKYRHTIKSCHERLVYELNTYAGPEYSRREAEVCH
jgi:hypothetical protein